MFIVEREIEKHSVVYHDHKVLVYATNVYSQKRNSTNNTNYFIMGQNKLKSDYRKHKRINVFQKWLNTSLAAPGALAHRLQHLTARFIQNGQRGPEIGKTLGYWTHRSTFAK